MTTETARLEAFSYGVFAIAITLVILEIKGPMSATGRLAPQLLRASLWEEAFIFCRIGILRLGSFSLAKKNSRPGRQVS